MSALSDHILSHVDIIDLVGRYVSLTKKGSNYAGLCPFHSEKTPSFLVSPTKQIYKCFGCGRGGNAIGFLMEIERLDYGDAIKILADQHSIDLSDFESKWKASPEYKSEKEKAKRITKLAQDYFLEQLTTTEGIQTLHYLKNNRGLSDDLIRQLGLGYAPSQSHVFFSYFQKFGFQVDDLLSIGLARQGTNEIYAFFRDRLTIPIRDQLGNIIGFGARALHDGQEPKYLNSPETIIYDKSSVLYGIDHVKQGVRDYKSIIVVEGYFDVIALLTAGLEIGVATCGTALTDHHVKTLQRYTDNVYFLFDNDKAGQMATLRGLSVAYSQGVYPKIISLASHDHLATDDQDRRGYKDIDEFVRYNQNTDQNVQTLIQNAQDGFQWAIHHFTNIFSLSSPVERQKILYGLFDLVYSTQTMSIQNLFLEQIAAVVGLDYALVLSQYRHYVKTEKKVFRRRDDQGKGEQERQKRTNQKTLLLGALLYHKFWESIDLNADWIRDLEEFLKLVHYDLDNSDPEEYNEWQLWRENELSVCDDAVQKITLIKRVLLPHLHSLQQDALKHLNQDEKGVLLQLVGKLR